MKRDTTQTIWRTVVFAGAMLGAPACSKQAQPVAPGTPTATTNTTNSSASKVPSNTSSAGDTSMTPMKKPATTTTADPCAGDADPCGGAPPPARPRGTDDDGGGGMGRGFVLS